MAAMLCCPGVGVAGEKLGGEEAGGQASSVVAYAPACTHRRGGDGVRVS